MRVGVLTLAAMIVASISVSADAQQAQKLNECEQSVSYTIQPPAPDIPANVRAFSGAWIGKWDMGLCSAVIVEAVNADGTAQLVYVFGSYSTYRIKAGNSRFPGKIVGNKLTADNGRVAIQYVVSSPSQLSGTYTAQGSMSGGSFTRR